MLCGSNWKSLSKKYNYKNLINEPIYGPKYSEAISNSKIALTFFSPSNKDLYTRRVYEIPAAGTLLASPITMAMLSIYSLNECIYFSNEQDIIEHIKPVIENKNIWTTYMNKVREKVSKEEFSIYGRAKEFLTTLNKIIN